LGQFLSNYFGQFGHPTSSPSLRQRFDVIQHDFDAIVKEKSAALIRRVAPQITPVTTSCGPFVPLDIDVSPFNNSKTLKELLLQFHRRIHHWDRCYMVMVFWTDR